MINFTREEVFNQRYSCTLDEFMEEYYASAAVDHENEDLLLIFVKSGLNNSNMSWVFDVPYIEGLDINNKADVKEMIGLAKE